MADLESDFSQMDGASLTLRKEFLSARPGMGEASDSGATETPSPALIEQILRMRAKFPDTAISYELQFSIRHEREISAIMHASQASGLQVHSLRRNAVGELFCKLGDDGGADIRSFSRWVRSCGDLSRWTTILGRRSN